VPDHGFRIQSAIFEHSASSNGQISPQWSKGPRPWGQVLKYSICKLKALVDHISPALTAIFLKAYLATVARARHPVTQSAKPRGTTNRTSMHDRRSDFGVGSQLRHHTLHPKSSVKKQLGSDPNITGQRPRTIKTIAASAYSMSARGHFLLKFKNKANSASASLPTQCTDSTSPGP